MTIEQFERIHGILVHSSGPSWLGNYRFDKGRVSLWILASVDTREIEAARWVLPNVNIKRSRSSLRRYLCTGKETTLITILGGYEARQASVLLDGEEIGVLSEFGLRLEASTASHDLIIRKDNSVLLESSIDLSDKSIGEHFIWVAGLEAEHQDRQER